MALPTRPVRLAAGAGTIKVVEFSGSDWNCSTDDDAVQPVNAAAPPTTNARRETRMITHPNSPPQIIVSGATTLSSHERITERRLDGSVAFG
jgi:hypothetical protein